MIRDQAEKLRMLARSLKEQVEEEIITVETVPKSETVAKPIQRETKVIAVTSGKGGVGKTNFTINLAIALQRLGKQVIVFDADLGLANADVVLGVSPKYNLYHLINGEKGIEEIITDGPEGIKLIAGGSGMQELANLPKKRLQKFVNMLGNLEGQADYLIIDTGAGLSRSVLSFVMAADEVIVVCTPEPTSITDAYGLVKTLYSKKPEAQVQLVVNRVEGEEEGLNTANKFTMVAQKFLKVPIKTLGFINDDSTVSKSVKEQVPFIIKNPKSKASQCMTALAENLAQVPKEEVNKDGGIRSFFSKIVGFFG